MLNTINHIVHAMSIDTFSPKSEEIDRDKLLSYNTLSKYKLMAISGYKINPLRICQSDLLHGIAAADTTVQTIKR